MKYTVFECRKCEHRLFVGEVGYPEKLERVAGMNCPSCGEQREGLWCLLGRANSFKGKSKPYGRKQENEIHHQRKSVRYR